MEKKLNDLLYRFSDWGESSRDSLIDYWLALRPETQYACYVAAGLFALLIVVIIYYRIKTKRLGRRLLNTSAKYATAVIEGQQKQTIEPDVRSLLMYVISEVRNQRANDWEHMAKFADAAVASIRDNAERASESQEQIISQLIELQKEQHAETMQVLREYNCD